MLQARSDAPEARAVLGELCETYWAPVFRFLRREGRSDEDCHDLTQEFFARLLEGGKISQVDPRKGRFRSYLLGALKHFLTEQKRNQSRQKRGGEAVILSIESGGTDTSPGIAVPDTKSVSECDASFDREWALAVMDQALAAVRADFDAVGKGRQFEVLKAWLIGDAEGLSQKDAAEQLGLSTGALKVAIHRIRKNFRDAVTNQIAETVADPEDVAAELRYLIEVCS